MLTIYILIIYFKISQMCLQRSPGELKLHSITLIQETPVLFGTQSIVFLLIGGDHCRNILGRCWLMGESSLPPRHGLRLLSWCPPPPPKKKGEYRLCIDYRKLNSVTNIDAYPMPSILESLHGATVIRWLLSMAPKDIEKTAFICEEGLFQFTVLPFGVVNGPASFQRLMERVIGDLIGKICYMYVYLEDIVCFSPTISQHFHDLTKVMQKLRESVNVEKCCFARRGNDLPRPCCQSWGPQNGPRQDPVHLQLPCA